MRRWLTCVALGQKTQARRKVYDTSSGNNLARRNKKSRPEHIPGDFFCRARAGGNPYNSRKNAALKI